MIAVAIKRDEAIECLAWYHEGGVAIKACVYGYFTDTTYKYKTNEGQYAFAEPIPRKVLRIMPPERAIPVLIAEGWRFDARGALIGEPYCIVPQMFAKMGKPLEDNSWEWPPCIIEEVEDDE